MPVKRYSWVLSQLFSLTILLHFAYCIVMNEEAKTQLLAWLSMRGMSQSAFAAKAGINYYHLNACLSENDNTKMGLATAQKIHAVTGISLDILCKSKS